MNTEDAVIGIALYEPGKIPAIKDQVRPDYLKSPDNKTILRTIYRLHEDNQDVTPVTVAEELEGEQLEGIGGASYLADLSNQYSVLESEGFETVLDKLIDNHVKREARKTLINGREELENHENAVSVMQNVTATLDNLQQKTVTNEVSHITDSTDHLLDMLKEAQETGALPGTLSTGFAGLDDRMKGIAQNDFILISADTGLGKTSLALQITDTVTNGQGGNALIFSGEMHGHEIIMKLLSKRGVASLDDMQDGELSDNQWSRMVKELNQLEETGLYTIRESQPTIYDFKAALRKADNENGIDLAVLDYVQMLSNPSPETLSSVEHLNMVSSELRDFTNDIDVPVLAISRENKGGEIYGSSQLKYDCNYRIVIKDPEPNNDESKKRLLKVEKARLAKGGALKMKFEGKNSRFIRPGRKVKHGFNS